MNTVKADALNAYSKVGLETGIAAASPHKLVSMLFEGAIVAIAVGKRCMQRNEIGPKGEAISKAIAIIDQGLKVSLDQEAGGEMARNLGALYDYMSSRLLMANLKNDLDGLDEVERLLSELKDAWDVIGRQPQAVALPLAEEAKPRASMSYGKA